MSADPALPHAQPLRSQAPRLAALPGLRTLRAPRFRLVLALTLVALGSLVLGAAMIRQASQPTGQFAIDLADYHGAARALAETGSPYAPEMMTGPVDAQGQQRYRYPPPLAQVLVPTTSMPLGTLATGWLALQALAMVLAVWLSLGAAGVARHAERMAWSAVACLLFMPVFDTLWKGNVSGFVALQVAGVALAGSAAGAAAASGVLLKVAPLTLVPGILAAGRRGVIAAGATAAIVVGASVALSPDAWSDYLVVLPNLLAGSADHPTNLAPAAILAGAGLPGSVVDLVRLATLLLAAGLTVAAPVVTSRRADRHGWSAAVTLGTAAMLLLPAACWYHYLAVLLPVAALAWPAATARHRAALLAGAASITLGVAALPVATLGAAVVVVAALWVHWRAPTHDRRDP